jgi:hypothetical protein
VGVAAGVGVGFFGTEVLLAEDPVGEPVTTTQPSATPTTPSASSPASVVTTTIPDTEVEYGVISVDGSPLPTFQPGDEDPATGQLAPTVSGATFEGLEQTVGPDGRPKILVLLSHWCPHCQAVVPNIVAWVSAGGTEGVEVLGISTSTDRLRPNWPPEDWLEAEGWFLPTILDDEAGTASEAFGASGLPFFIVVDGNNHVLLRFAGEVTNEDLVAMAEIAVSGVPPSSSATSTTVPGDLSLTQPMVRPDCDGSFATFIGASVNPDRYSEEIGDYLRRYPEAKYLRTDVACSSLRPRTDSGEVIYAVFFGPFVTFEEACQAAAGGPSGSYVKPLDNVSDPNEIPECE